MEKQLLNPEHPHHPYYVLREVVGRTLVSTFYGIHYTKFKSEEGELSLRICFNHWYLTNIIFTFNERIDAYFETGLPDLLDLNKELCPSSMSLKDKLKLITTYVCACNELIEKYGLLCKYASQLEDKFKGSGIIFTPVYDLSSIIATYILYVKIPKIGICSFDIANKFMLFSMEPHIPRRVFGIHVKPEEMSLWRRVQNSQVENLHYTIIGNFEIDSKGHIYGIIENAIETAYIESQQRIE